VKNVEDIVELLRGGDRRSIGRADQVAAIVSKETSLFARLIAGMWDDDDVVKIRAADAAEKVSRERPKLLLPFKGELLGLMGETEQQELRWHLAAMIPRMDLEPRERALAMRHLRGYLEDRSSIVKTYALEGIWELSREDPNARAEAVEILREAVRTGTAAMKARSRKILARIEHYDRKMEKGK
jgi:hypothetical protein